jgi:predicted homoserine dehydrogenase-like protein
LRETRQFVIVEASMNLSAMLLERDAAGRPVTVGLIGAGKFGTMFLAQAGLTRGLHVATPRFTGRST